MKSVIVVGSVARNSKVLVEHVLDDLSSKYDHIYISKSFCDCRLYPNEVIWVTGKGNIESRLRISENNPLNDHFDVCVLPYHGMLAFYEIEALAKYDLDNFLYVKSDHTTRFVTTKTNLLDLFRPNLRSDPLIIN